MFLMVNDCSVYDSVIVIVCVSPLMHISEEVVRSLWVVITGGCEWQQVDTGNQTWVLWK